MDRRPAPPVALYVHFPFCLSICPYCDFVVYAGSAARGPTSRIEPYIAALLTELELRADALDRRFGTSRGPLESLYLGGGTPSLVAAETIARLIERVQDRFGLTRDAEVTIEANPGADERGDAVELRAAGITRLSVGAQSFDDVELRTLGRRHRASDVAETVAAAGAAGIRSVSIDLLYDVPGGTQGRWQRSLQAALRLEPDHLSLYALTLDDPDAEGLTGAEGDHLPTPSGARRWRERVRAAQDDDRAADQYHHAVERLTAEGWRGYEISNWARPGHESRHNLAYWERRAYEAIGPGAHAFDGITRRWNAARLDRYVSALTPTDGSAPALPPGGSERVNPTTARTETVILGLRTDRGVEPAVMGEPRYAEAFAWATSNDLVDSTPEGRVILTTRGRLLSNELFARLL